jgi:multiple sugar transport system substrate-binding protein
MRGEFEVVRRTFWCRIALLVGAAAILGPFASTASSSTSPAPSRAGSLTMMSTQFNTVDETATYKSKILAGAPSSVNFVGADAATFTNQITAQEQAHSVKIDVMGGLYGDLEPLAQAGYLQDLSPLLKKLQKRGFPKSFVSLAHFGTKNHVYFIPWMQATYVLAANQRALKYLPKGAHFTSLTYSQLIQWGKNLQAKQHKKLVGLPAGPTSLIHRFVQGYLYPSYTKSMVTGFRSKNAITMWKMARQLWNVTNPQSTNYNFMQDPLLSGEVWVAWDHVARLINAVSQQPTQFVMAPSPRGPAGLGYMVVIGGLAIPKGTPNTKAAENLIDYLTQPKQQINTLTSLAFFPATNVKVPISIDTGTWIESHAVNLQAHAKHTVPALVPVGLGQYGGAFNQVYIESFHRIAINGESPQSVLNDEASKLNGVLDQAKAPCWAPDPKSKGTCHAK